MPQRRSPTRRSFRPEGGHPSDRCRPPFRRPPTSGRLRVGKGGRLHPGTVAAFTSESLAAFIRNTQLGIHLALCELFRGVFWCSGWRRLLRGWVGTKRGPRGPGRGRGGWTAPCRGSARSARMRCEAGALVRSGRRRRQPRRRWSRTRRRRRTEAKRAAGRESCKYRRRRAVRRSASNGITCCSRRGWLRLREPEADAAPMNWGRAAGSDRSACRNRSVHSRAAGRGFSRATD